MHWAWENERFHSRERKKNPGWVMYPPGNPAEPERIVKFFYLDLFVRFVKVVFIHYYEVTAVS